MLLQNRESAERTYAKNNFKYSTYYKGAVGRLQRQDFEEEHTEEEVASMLKRAGLPHAQRAKYQPEKSKERYPEEQELEDKLVKEGEALGRKHRGRGGLPERLLAKRITPKKK